MKKAELNIKQVKQLYKKYGSTHKVAKELHTSHLRVAELLREAGCTMNNVGKRRDVSGDELSMLIDEYVNQHLKMEEIAKKYSVRIKKLRKLFNDNGVAISKWNGHIKKEKSPKKEHKPKPDLPKLTCPYCGWTTIDVDGRANAYLKHLVHHHKIDIDKHLEEYPDDIKYLWREKQRRDEMVQCKVCGKWMHLIDNRHLKKHGMNKLQYVNLFGGGKLISNETMEKYQQNFANAIGDDGFCRHKSMYEDMICEWLDEIGIEYKKDDRTVLDGLEIDILSGDIGIEVNGNQWHTETFGGKDRNYHLSKTESANEQGVRLMHIFSDEIIEHKDIVKSKIYRLFGASDGLERVYGRKCTINEINAVTAQEFLENNHIQGFATASVYLAAFNNGRLVGVMTFINDNDGKWNLNRFASDINMSCIGVGGKLFSYFIKHYDPIEVRSFADRRWTLSVDRNLYTNLGFELDSILPPEYRYYNPRVDKVKRFHKFGFRKEKLMKLHGFPIEMTETEMTKALGYDRIWDCGLFRYVWKKKLD